MDLTQGDLTKMAMVAVLGLIVLWIARFLIRWNNDEQNPFEFRKLFLNDKGDVDRLIVGWWWAMAVMSWVVFYLTLRNRVTWDILGTFCVLAVAPTSIALFKGGGSASKGYPAYEPPKKEPEED